MGQYFIVKHFQNEHLIQLRYTHDDFGSAVLIWQQGEIIFMQVSISSTQTFPPMQSLSATHGPNRVAQAPFGHACIPLFCGAPEINHDGTKLYKSKPILWVKQEQFL